eukprot:scaffold142543_cov30-Prasinocladus_malaysianus.AAC.1
MMTNIWIYIVSQIVHYDRLLLYLEEKQHQTTTQLIRLLMSTGGAVQVASPAAPVQPCGVHAAADSGARRGDRVGGRRGRQPLPCQER